jgi:hypothetical protein
VFRCFPFFCVLIMSIVSVMVPYVCPMFNMWFEYPELRLFLIACMFFVSNVECSACLPYVFQWAV